MSSGITFLYTFCLLVSRICLMRRVLDMANKKVFLSAESAIHTFAHIRPSHACKWFVFIQLRASNKSRRKLARTLAHARNAYNAYIRINPSRPPQSSAPTAIFEETDSKSGIDLRYGWLFLGRKVRLKIFSYNPTGRTWRHAYRTLNISRSRARVVVNHAEIFSNLKVQQKKKKISLSNLLPSPARFFFPFFLYTH